jgi:ABC-type multidrug transport system fused ATPase/permease subunit
MADKTPLLPSLRLVASMVRPHPVPFSVAVVGSIVYAAATVGTTIALGWVVDDIVLPEFAADTELSSDALWTGVIFVALVFIARAAGIVTRRYYAGMTAASVMRTFRDDLGERYLTLPMAWHRSSSTGRLLAHTDADAETTVEALHPLPFSLGVSSLALFAVISAFVVDPPLAVVGVIVFPLMITLNRWYTRLVEAPAARVQEAIGDVSAVAHESFDGALIVKTLGRAGEESRRFATTVDRLRHERVGLGVMRSVFHSTVETLPQLGIAAVTVVGVYRLDAGAITTGELVQFVALFSVLAFPMQVFGFFLESIPPSVVAHSRIQAVLDTPVPTLPSRSAAIETGPARLDAIGLGLVHSDGTEVLRGIEIHVEPGQTVAVVGSTGSGKSTLAGILAGLDPATSGVVRLDGVDLSELRLDHRSRHIAYVFQEPFLFGDSVRANIDLAGQASLGDIRWAAGIARIDEFVGGLPDGYDTVLGERGVTLSGGQRQRVALARALVRRPRLLVLDDATSAVDPHVEQEILAGLRDGLDTTMVIVAQRLSTIELADRVLFLRGGAIRAEGRHDELMADAEYANLVTAYEQAAL